MPEINENWKVPWLIFENTSLENLYKIATFTLNNLYTVTNLAIIKTQIWILKELNKLIIEFKQKNKWLK